MQPHLYSTDTAKIAFIISQLQGKALQWADSLWTQKGSVVKSYPAFVSHFREVFGRPLTDSSNGEKLYNLKQGNRNVTDYTLQFRTLAASSGWNEQALITTYRQGLEPNLRLHLAAYEDSEGLERFIQLALRVGSRMQSCLLEHQGQPLANTFLRRSEPVSSPEPVHSITGKPLSRKTIRRCVGPLQLQVGILHTENIHLLVLEDSTADVVLGRSNASETDSAFDSDSADSDEMDCSDQPAMSCRCDMDEVIKPSKHSSSMKQVVNIIVALKRMKHVKPKSSEFGEEEVLDIIMENVIQGTTSKLFCS
ncbi:Retrotransposon-like protein 1 [Anabarilius grahami]|uniref:Retrotransposon-like protein 1 n=1 Tax=Anabarilius grahami TaxID=495550 RepID=A0A3N0Z6G8_ANAGA|nr:Retrotransposon-like protein 1 [Anabarilius grahami]